MPLGLAISPFTLRIVVAAAITLFFAAGARALRGVTRSGALAGSLLSFLLCISAGSGAFVLLLAVFVLSYFATRFGRSRKEALGTAEKREGRKASQVLANLGVGTAAAMLYALRGHSLTFSVAMVAAFAEAATDTVSSEVGQSVREETRLITTWKAVPAGTDGGMTRTGTLAGCLASLLISALSGLTNLIPWTWVPIAVIAAVFGMLFDSLLGATIERRGVIGNDQVNLLGTLAAAILAVCVVVF